jgi:hypothetical protein
VCRAAAGDCDVEEKCTGSSADCPGDAFVAADTVCRAAAGDCDVEEKCTGTSAACPANAFRPDSFVSRQAAAGGCDAEEKCTGSSDNRTHFCTEGRILNALVVGVTTPFPTIGRPGTPEQVQGQRGLKSSTNFLVPAVPPGWHGRFSQSAWTSTSLRHLGGKMVV